MDNIMLKFSEYLKLLDEAVTERRKISRSPAELSPADARRLLTKGIDPTDPEARGVRPEPVPTSPYYQKKTGKVEQPKQETPQSFSDRVNQNIEKAKSETGPKTVPPAARALQAKQDQEDKESVQQVSGTTHVPGSALDATNYISKEGKSLVAIDKEAENQPDEAERDMGMSPEVNSGSTQEPDFIDQLSAAAAQENEPETQQPVGPEGVPPEQQVVKSFDDSGNQVDQTGQVVYGKFGANFNPIDYDISTLQSDQDWEDYYTEQNKWTDNSINQFIRENNLNPENDQDRLRINQQYQEIDQSIRNKVNSHINSQIDNYIKENNIDTTQPEGVRQVKSQRINLDNQQITLRHKSTSAIRPTSVYTPNQDTSDTGLRTNEKGESYIPYSGSAEQNKYGKLEYDRDSTLNRFGPVKTKQIEAVFELLNRFIIPGQPGDRKSKVAAIKSSWDLDQNYGTSNPNYNIVKSISDYFEKNPKLLELIQRDSDSSLIKPKVNKRTGKPSKAMDDTRSKSDGNYLSVETVDAIRDSILDSNYIDWTPEMTNYVFSHLPSHLRSSLSGSGASQRNTYHPREDGTVIGDVADAKKNDPRGAAFLHAWIKQGGRDAYSGSDIISPLSMDWEHTVPQQTADDGVYTDDPQRMVLASKNANLSRSATRLYDWIQGRKKVTDQGEDAFNRQIETAVKSGGGKDSYKEILGYKPKLVGGKVSKKSMDFEPETFRNFQSQFIQPDTTGKDNLDSVPRAIAQQYGIVPGDARKYYVRAAMFDLVNNKIKQNGNFPEGFPQFDGAVTLQRPHRAGGDYPPSKALSNYIHSTMFDPDPETQRKGAKDMGTYINSWNDFIKTGDIQSHYNTVLKIASDISSDPKYGPSDAANFVYGETQYLLDHYNKPAVRSYIGKDKFDDSMEKSITSKMQEVMDALNNNQNIVSFLK
jgi:hypothetical protein